MKVKRSEAVALFEGLGFAAAPKWTREKLLSKMLHLPKSVSAPESIGDSELDNLCDEIIAAVNEDEEIELVNDGNGSFDKPEKKSIVKSIAEAESAVAIAEPPKKTTKKRTAKKKVVLRKLKVVDEEEDNSEEEKTELLYSKSTLTAACVHIDQNGKEFLLAALPASLICDVSYVAVRGVSEESTAVQRLLSKARVGKIKEYKDRGGHFPGSIVLNWVNKDSIKIGKSEATIQNVARSAQIIDGQHRIEGLRKSLEDGGDDILIPVAIYHDLEPEDAANIFLSLNTEQKPVPKKFVYEIYGLASDYIVDDRLNKTRELALSLLDHSKSPLKSAYKDALSKSRIGINLATAISGLKPLVGDKGQFKLLGVGTVEKQSKLLLAFFGALKDWYGKDWNIEDNVFRYAAGFLGAVDFFRSTLLPYFVRNKISVASAVRELMEADADLLLMSELKGLGGGKARSLVAEGLAKVFNLPEDEEEEEEEDDE